MLNIKIISWKHVYKSLKVVLPSIFSLSMKTEILREQTNRFALYDW